jgi:p-aminobenzoyl-glutamate transporter AbgT
MPPKRSRSTNVYMIVLGGLATIFFLMIVIVLWETFMAFYGTEGTVFGLPFNTGIFMFFVFLFIIPAMLLGVARILMKK